MAEFIMTVGEDLLGKPCFIYREEDRVWHMGMYSPHAAHSGGEVKIFRGNDLIHSSVIVDVRFGTALRHVFGKWANQNGYANMKFSDLKNGDVLKLTVPDVDGDPLVLDKWIANRRDLYIKAFQDMASKLGRKPTREDMAAESAAIDKSLPPVPDVPFPD